MAIVKAPMFGTLAMYHVEDGAHVESGEDLGEIEAMKTFFRFHAANAGTVRWLVGLGEVIGEGDPLVEVK